MVFFLLSLTISTKKKKKKSNHPSASQSFKIRRKIKKNLNENLPSKSKAALVMIFIFNNEFSLFFRCFLLEGLPRMLCACRKTWARRATSPRWGGFSSNGRSVCAAQRRSGGLESFSDSWKRFTSAWERRAGRERPKTYKT